MNEKHSSSSDLRLPVPFHKLKQLKPERILRIDERLASAGDYGEIHRIVQRGELHFSACVVLSVVRAPKLFLWLGG